MTSAGVPRATSIQTDGRPTQRLERRQAQQHDDHANRNRDEKAQRRQLQRLERRPQQLRQPGGQALDQRWARTCSSCHRSPRLQV